MGKDLTELRNLHRQLVPDRVGPGEHEPTFLREIAIKAKANRCHRFQDLYRYLNVEYLMWCWPQLIANAYNVGVSNYIGTPSYACVQEIRADIGAVITRIERNPSLFAEALSPVGSGPDQRKLLEAVDQLVLRFHAVVVQLRNRREERPTLDVNDEYDVQDLVHVLLRLYFDDVHPEEWVPSYAGSASRTDFLLPAVDNVIEVKKTRQGLNAKVIGERLIIDIARYKQHPQCRRLICFVYDPEGRITNPAGIESDLNRDARRSRPFSLVRWAAVEPRQSESATKGYPAVEEWMRYEDLGHG